MDQTPPTPGLYAPALPVPRHSALRAIGALILREMSSTYGRNPGGYIWAFLQPLGAITVLTLAFSMLVRSPPLGTSFVLFYATGFLPFDLYNTIQGVVQGSIRGARSLLAYPRVTWLDAVLARFLLNSLTETTVMCIVWLGVVLLSDTHAIISVGPILTGILMALLLGLGVGLVNALLVGLFPIWATLWGIINRPLFLASGIFFLYEDMPPIAQEILWWNPLVHVIALVRSGFYPTYHPDYVSLTYVFGLALSLITLGLVLLQAWYKRVLEL